MKSNLKVKNKKTPPPKKTRGKKKTPDIPVSQGKQKIRTIQIVTDGNSFKIVKADVTALEFREICRSIIKALGGTA